jgi:outer membrane protein, heavy metal efflux system
MDMAEPYHHRYLEEGKTMKRKSAAFFFFPFACFLFLVGAPHLHAQPAGEALDLNGIIEEALKNNPELKGAQAKADAYRERPAQAGSLEDPRISVGVQNIATDDFDFNSIDMTMKVIELSQEVPLPGILSLKKEVALHEAHAMEKKAKETEFSLIKKVKQAYYDLYYLKNAIAIAGDNKALLERFVEITETRYAVGKGLQQDVLKAQVELSKIKEKLIDFEQKKASTAAELRALLNRPPEASIGDPPTIEKTPFNYTMEELQNIALECNPGLNDLQSILKSRESEYRLAQKEYFPSFMLTAAYGQREDAKKSGSLTATGSTMGGEPVEVSIPGEDDHRSDTFSFMVGFTVPLWFHSKQNRKVKETLAMMEETKSHQQAMKNAIFFSLKDIGERERRGAKLIDLYKNNIIPQAQASLDSARAAYEVGNVDFMTLIENQITLFDYQLSYHEVLAGYEKDLAEIESVVGRRLF